MKLLPIKIENGVIKLPNDFKIPPDGQLSILLTRKNEEYISVLEGNKSFTFLDEEPDLYNDNDILQNRKNENFSA